MRRRAILDTMADPHRVADAMHELSFGTLARIERLFLPEDRAEAAALLARCCSTGLPGTRDWPRLAIERIQFAALKVSEGSMPKLIEAVRIANVDWRDLLVAAGFAHDTRVHESWMP